MARGWIHYNAYKYRILELRRAEPHLDYNQIAERIGCSFHTAKNECVKAGLGIGKRPPDYAKRAAKIAALKRHGLTHTLIAARLQVDRHTISRTLRRSNATGNR